MACAAVPGGWAGSCTSAGLRMRVSAPPQNATYIFGDRDLPGGGPAGGLPVVRAVGAAAAVPTGRVATIPWRNRGGRVTFGNSPGGTPVRLLGTHPAAPRHPRWFPRFAAAGLAAVVAGTLFLVAAPAQVPEKARGLKTNQASKRNVGSARVLTGSVCLFNLFVEDGQSSWTKKERDTVRVRMEAATDFVSLYARKYKKKLTIVQAYQDGLHYEPGLPTDMFVSPTWTEEVFRLTGSAGGNELVEDLKKRHGVEQVLLLIHIDREER